MITRAAIVENKQLETNDDDGEPDGYVPDECCFVCFFVNPLKELGKTSCCNQLLHGTCYDKTTKSKQTSNRERYSLMQLEEAKKEAS